MCLPWTDTHWATYKSRRYADKHMVGGMFPTRDRSALVLHAVQVEVDRKQCPHASQPRRYHDMSPLGPPAATCHYHSSVFPVGGFYSCCHRPIIISYFFAYYAGSSACDEPCDVSHGVLFQLIFLAPVVCSSLVVAMVVLIPTSNLPTRVIPPFSYLFT